MELQTEIDIETGLRNGLHSLRSRIGQTPLHRVEGLFLKNNVQIFAKKEWKQLSGSVKARAAFQIIEAAVRSGELRPGKILLDATSGNTGIAYAAIAKELGLKVTLCLPENASMERKSILRSLGAEVVFTSKFEGTDGAQEVARELVERRPDLYFYANQYKNANNWRAHFEHTAVEILRELPETTHFVAGLGTTGTFIGTGRRLKKHDPAIQLISLQPNAPMHGLEGWKHLETAVVPTIFDENLADQNLEIDTAEAYQLLKSAHRHEGLLLSPSSAANLLGAIKIAEKLDHGTVVTVLPDDGFKYREVIKQIFGHDLF